MNKSRHNFSVDGTGRHFTEQRLEEWRKELCRQLRATEQWAKIARAESYEKMSLKAFAAQGGYVIVSA